MKVLIATPCYGGLLSQFYFMSFFKTVDQANDLGWRVGTMTLGNESLIPRGRNTCAATFLKSDWDKIFFIDADITWTFEDFKKVVTSENLIVGGACPLKRYPIQLSFNVFDRDSHFFPSDQKKTVDGFRAMSQAYGNKELAVRHVGSAFLCIDRSVLEALKPHVESYTDTTTPEPIEAWDFFRVGVSPIDNTYHSEDWGFCQLAAEHGFVTHLHPDIIVQHSGTHTFKVGL